MTCTRQSPSIDQKAGKGGGGGGSGVGWVIVCVVEKFRILLMKKRYIYIYIYIFMFYVLFQKMLFRKRRCPTTPKENVRLVATNPNKKPVACP